MRDLKKVNQRLEVLSKDISSLILAHKMSIESEYSSGGQPEVLSTSLALMRSTIDRLTEVAIRDITSLPEV